MTDVLRLPGKGINSFVGLREVTRGAAIDIDLSDNALWSFESFGTHEQLRVLDVSRNDIESFLGLTKQRKLERLLLAGNPITRNPHYRIMALLTVGFSLKVIDDQPVELVELERARQLGPNAALAVSCGWKLDLLPRDDAEFHAIITSLRSERRTLLTKHNLSKQITVLDAAHLSEAQVPSGHSADSAPAVHPAAEAEERSVQKKALAHLSRRVANLEAKLHAAEAELSGYRRSRSSADAPAPLRIFDNARAVDGLTPAEACGLRDVSVDLRSVSSNQPLGRCAMHIGPAILRLGREDLSVLTLLNHQRVFEQRWSNVHSISLVATSSIAVDFLDGAALRIEMESNRFFGCWKLLHYQAGKQPPVVPGLVSPKPLETPALQAASSTVVASGTQTDDLPAVLYPVASGVGETRPANPAIATLMSTPAATQARVATATALGEDSDSDDSNYDAVVQNAEAPKHVAQEERDEESDEEEEAELDESQEESQSSQSQVIENAAAGDRARTAQAVNHQLPLTAATSAAASAAAAASTVAAVTTQSAPPAASSESAPPETVQNAAPTQTRPAAVPGKRVFRPTFALDTSSDEDGKPAQRRRHSDSDSDGD
jgi:hypothetical protein